MKSFILKILSILCFCFIGTTQTIIAQEEIQKEKTKLFSKRFTQKHKKQDSKTTKKQKKPRTQFNKIQLKNGPSFEGKIIKQTPDSITFRLKSWSEVTFHQSNILNTSQIEQIPLSQNSKKYYCILNFSYTFGKYQHQYEYIDNNWSPTGPYRYTNGITTQWIIGKKIHDYFSTGLAVGFTTYQHVNIIPINIDIRGDLFPYSKITPYYYGGIGYGFIVDQKSSYYKANTKGNLFYNYGMGIKLKGNKTNLLLGLGQQSQLINWSAIMPNNSYHNQDNWYNRIALKFGIDF